jgi:hypothetical protein
VRVSAATVVVVYGADQRVTVFDRGDNVDPVVLGEDGRQAVAVHGVVVGHDDVHGHADLKGSSLPSYSGTYRGKLNAVLVEMSFDDDAERIAQFRLRSQLAGTDGSSLQPAMSGKVTRNRNGEVVVDRFNFTCD